MVEVAELLTKYPKHAAKYDPAEAFRQLSDPDPPTRFLGAKWLAKQAHGEVNNFTEYWLKDPATVDRLLPLLDDPDPLVVEHLIGAARMIVSRYRKDDRLIPRALQLLKSDRANTRGSAAMLLTNFDDESLADPLLSLFADPDKSVRSLAIGEIARPARQWPAALQERVRLATLERLRDRATEVRCAAAGLLISVGKEEDLKPLQQGLKEIKGANYRQDYRESIGLLKQRLRPGS